MRRMQPSGVCACCGRGGPVFAEVERSADGIVTVDADRASLPPLCDDCDFAQRRWDARQFQLRHPCYGYPYMERPPKTPPVRRATDRDLGPDGWPV